jgi:hypothetical protein
MSQQQVASGNLTDLQQEYMTLYDQYESLWRQAKNVRGQGAAAELAENLKALNVRLGEVLERMMSFQTESPSEVRNELVRRLAEIQRDYNGLLTSTDKLTTLRTIRAHEGKAANETLTLYLFAFVALAVALLVMMLWKGSGSQTYETTAMTPTSPAAMNAFT